MYYRHILSATIISASILSFTSCSSGDKSKTDKNVATEETLPIVEIQKVYEQDVPQITEYTATIEAFKTNNITSSTPNRIKNILVDIGSHVSKGQKVVVLDDVNIEQLRVRLENYRKEYDRAVKLLEIGGGTQQAVDQLKTELDAATRQYSNILENTVLVSPIDGVVTARNYDPGDMTGNLPILTIEQMKPVKVIVNVSESDFAKIHKGDKVEVKCDVYPDEVFTGTVYLIHPSIDAATRTFVTEITIANADNRIRPGMFARVIINFGVSKHVVVPDRAVVKQSGSGNKYIYVYNPETKTVNYNRVELGQRIDNSYEIIDGVTNGNDVVIAGQSRLADGVQVELSKSTPTQPTPDSAE
ncbi:MAG: efflux RND transporter periplasmic adaptor subunit [Paramuribaculum sp.]|nr:efflux RND transporter periplasmic adaptor subunit [Paramuribaculum sp.]